MRHYHEAGKGSNPRPVDKKKYDDNFDKIFCNHQWKYIDDGDYGSHWICVKCGLKKQ